MGERCGWRETTADYWCVPDGSGGGGGGGGGTGCGDVTFLGRCRDTYSVEWCNSGTLQVDSCAVGQVCGWVDDATGYACRPDSTGGGGGSGGAGCGDVTYLGRCSGSYTVEWCNSGSLEIVICPAGQVCRWVDEVTGYWCGSDDSGGGGGDLLCTDTCSYAGDGECDDGGSGSDSAVCEYGTDCTDCGFRS